MDDWFEREQLHRAAAAGDLGLVRELIDRGHPVNAFDELGKTPLHHAAVGEHADIVKLLLRSGANVNAHDERVIGDTPLGEVVARGSLSMVKLLVAAGADATIPGWMQLTAVDRALQRRRVEGTGSAGQTVYDFLR